MPAVSDQGEGNPNVALSLICSERRGYGVRVDFSAMGFDQSSFKDWYTTEAPSLARQPVYENTLGASERLIFFRKLCPEKLELAGILAIKFDDLRSVLKLRGHIWLWTAARFLGRRLSEETTALRPRSAARGAGVSQASD